MTARSICVCVCPESMICVLCASARGPCVCLSEMMLHTAHLQVKSASDASNFHAPSDENAAGGAYRGKPYVSRGDFKDF